MKKKILCSLLAACVIVSAGCGNNTAQNDSASEAASVSSVSDTSGDSSAGGASTDSASASSVSAVSESVLPEATPEVTPAEPTPDPNAAVRVDFQYISDPSTEYAVITGYSADDTAVWTYTTGQYQPMQLEQVSEVGLNNDAYYFVEKGALTALNLTDGSVRWKNEEFSGSCYAADFGDDGRIYLCGYYGPDLFIAEPTGETVTRIDSVSGDYMWAYEISYLGSQVAITYEQPAATLYVNLNDYSVSTEAAS